jgi:hypothetical protein
MCYEQLVYLLFFIYSTLFLSSPLRLLLLLLHKLLTEYLFSRGACFMFRDQTKTKLKEMLEKRRNFKECEQQREERKMLNVY